MNETQITLLRKVLDHIEAHPEEHDQGWWATRRYTETGQSCGTAYCLAGWTAVLDGWTPIFDEFENSEGVFEEEVTSYFRRTTTFGVAEDSAGRIARKALGLTQGQGDDLFAGNNTREDLWHVAARLTDGAITVPLHYGDPT